MNGGFFFDHSFLFYFFFQDFLSVAHYDHISLLLSRMLYSLENQSGSEWRRLTSSRQMKTFFCFAKALWQKLPNFVQLLWGILPSKLLKHWLAYTKLLLKWLFLVYWIIFHLRYAALHSADIQATQFCIASKKVEVRLYYENFAGFFEIFHAF